MSKLATLELVSIRTKQITQPLKRFNEVVSNSVGFTIFCIILIATGVIVWAHFS